MQTWHLPPMAGGSDGHHEVICIEARRICDFCFQEHHVERTFTGAVGTGNNVNCQIDQTGITCRVVERRMVDMCKKNEKELVCVAITVPVTLTVTDNAGNVVQTLNETVTFLKQAVLCVPEGTTVDCEVTGDCCCFIDTATGLISCIFDFCVILQTRVNVRVLVPTLGECQPKRCRSTILGCPPKTPDACEKGCKDKDCDD